mmetsp:Transcript_4872/g.16303  ORF Transcript_4872/g.16303 Transcript_4872/m.16303 type:complete len:277 (-) Transcript_4872:456-1286(-)
MKDHQLSPGFAAKRFELTTSNLLGDNPGAFGGRATWERASDYVNLRVDYELPLEKGVEMPNWVSAVSASGVAAGVSYDLTAEHPLSHDRSTRISRLRLSLPLGRALLMGEGVHAAPLAEGFKRDAVSLKELSSFVCLGPVNCQPMWLPQKNTLRLKVGRGNLFRRCPISLQVDRTPAGVTCEVGMRHVMEGRGLQARLVGAKRLLRLTYSDARVDKGADWQAVATLPLARRGPGGGSSSPPVTSAAFVFCLRGSNSARKQTRALRASAFPSVTSRE